MPRMVRVDGIEYEAGNESHLQAVDRQRLAFEAKAAADAQALAKLTADAKAASDLAAAEKKRADDEKARADKAADPKQIQALAAKRADMLDKCRSVAKALDVRFDEEEAAGATEEGMMLQALKAIDPDFDPAGKSPDFLMGYFLSTVKALLENAGEEEEETEIGDDMKAPGGDREQEVSGGVAPPAAPGRSDSRRRSRGDSGARSIYGARGTASREDGRGPSVQRDDKSKRQDSPDAAEARMRKDQEEAYLAPLAFTKDPPRPAPKA